MSEAHLVTELIAGLPKYATSLFTAGISRFPTTPGQHVIVLHSPYLFALDTADLLEVLLFARQFAREVGEITDTKRCGLAYDGHQCLHIIPMHGLKNHWEAVVAPEDEKEIMLDETFPGFLWTKNAPLLPPTDMTDTQGLITARSGWTGPDHTFYGARSDDTLFARLIRGKIPQWRVWEDANHLAFLTPFGNTRGYSVVIPRRHISSNIFGLADDDYRSLVIAAASVVPFIAAGLGVERVGMFFEGMEIDYAHVKLVPVHGSQALEGPSDEFSEVYPGYLTTRLGPEVANMSTLEKYR